MNSQELQEFVHSKIPLAEFMQTTISTLEPNRVEISAPLAPNSNVHGTLFGGSSTAVALIAAWCLVYQRMQRENLGSNLVVLRQTTTYSRPIGAAFTAAAVFENDNAWSEFAATLQRRSRARVAVVATVRQDGAGGQDEIGARIEAEFAASIRSD